jgi:hypothetical protein
MNPDLESLTPLQNPHTYHEDTLRTVFRLRDIESFPLAEVAASIEPTSHLPYYPSQARLNNWAIHTKNEPFELDFVTTPESNHVVTIECPKCPENPDGQSKPTVTVPWVTSYGMGYAQTKFTGHCPNCYQSFDREVSVRLSNCHAWGMFLNDGVKFRRCASVAFARKNLKRRRVR